MEDANHLQELFGSGELNPQSSRRASLMIIDDNHDVIEALATIFDQDYSLIPCRSFEAAEVTLKEHIRRGNLPVIILDIKMAGKDGLEVFRLLKAIHPDLRIIFHSAYPGGDIHAGMVASLPHAGYLTKGEYTLPELIRTIQAALRQ